MSIVKKLTGFIGAEISAVDLSAAPSETIASELREHLGAYHVLVLRDQYLSIEQQKRVTAIFGDLVTLPYVSPLAEDDQVIAVLKQADEVNTGVFGGDWHSDFSFLKNPPAGSVLNAIDVPATGGDTLWVNQQQAWQTLPDHLREIVDQKCAIHVGKPYGVKFAPAKADRANASIEMRRGDPDADREMLHPAVLTSSENGSKALFLNPIYTTRFEGMTEQQSAPYLQAIYQHVTKPDFACRHRWQAGDLVIWNNRTTLHYATNDYDGVRRLLYRTAFAGDIPC